MIFSDLLKNDILQLPSVLQLPARDSRLSVGHTATKNDELVSELSPWGEEGSAWKQSGLQVRWRNWPGVDVVMKRMGRREGEVNARDDARHEWNEK